MGLARIIVETPCPEEFFKKLGLAWLPDWAKGLFWGIFIDPTGIFPTGLVSQGGKAGITASEKVLQHVIDRHTIEGVKNTSASIFKAGENLLNLMKKADNVIRTGGKYEGTYQRIVDAGHVIGTDLITGKPTSIYTVITNSADELITMHPGLPKP